MQQLITTKRNLTFTFLFIILGIIFLLGITFFCVKFIDGEGKDTQDIRNISEEFSQRFLKNTVLPSLFPWTLPPSKWVLKWGMRDHEKIPFNVIVFDEDWRIEQQVINGRFDDLSEISNSFEKRQNFNPFKEDEIIFQFTKVLENKYLLVFKPLRYPFWDFLLDIGLFLFVMLFFSLPLFFIISYFVNRTLKPVEENMKDMQDFIHNAGHELKTPLSVMHGNLQIAQELKSYDASLSSEMIHEVEKMNQLIEWLVELTNINSWTEMDSFFLYDEIKEIVDTYDKKLKERNIECSINQQGHTKIQANKGYFYILFSNLFLNAIKYNSQNGKIIITIKRNSLSLQDTGIGIENKFHEKIFERFFKIDSSRNSSWFWIGLSLVKRVIEIYNCSMQS